MEPSTSFRIISIHHPAVKIQTSNGENGDANHFCGDRFRAPLGAEVMTAAETQIANVYYLKKAAKFRLQDKKTIWYAELADEGTNVAPNAIEL